MRQQVDKVLKYINEHWWSRLLSIIVGVDVLGSSMLFLSNIVADYVAIGITYVVVMIAMTLQLGSPKRESILGWAFYALVWASVLCMIYAAAISLSRSLQSDQWFWIGLGFAGLLVTLVATLYLVKNKDERSRLLSSNWRLECSRI